MYVLRVEDVESGLQWIIQKRYSDFHALNEELLEMSHFAHELEFPGKRLSLGRNGIAKLVESRIVALEQYMRKMLHLLSIYATMDHSASKSLRHVQNFLGVDNYLDCIHPPPMDDQRHVELSIYRFLNDFNSPACQQCIRFINNVDLDAMIVPGTTDGYLPVLNLVRDALAEVEQFVQQQHQMQTTKLLQMRRPDFNADQQLSFVRKCIRRQVEAALFLPLRRTLFRILQTALGEKSRKMQRSIELLQQAAPNFLLVDPFVVKAKSLPATIRAFRQVIQAYLPADQGQLLIQAAKAVSALHKECQEEKKNRSRCCDHRQATEIDAATAGRRHPNHIQTTAATTTTATTTLVVCDSNGTPIPEHGMQSSRGDDDSLIPRGGGAWSGELPVCCTSTTGRSKDSSPLRPGSNFLKDVMLVRKKSSGDLFSDSDSERDPVGVGGADDARMVRKARSGSLGFLRSTAVINDSSMVSFVDGTHAFSVSLDDHEQHQEQSQQGLGQRDGGSSGSNHTRVTRRHSSDQYRRSAQSLDSIMMAIDQGKGRGGKTAATSSNWNITDINNHHITHDIEDSRKQKQSTTKDSPSTIAVDDTMGAQQEIIIISSTPSSSSSSSSNVVDVLNNSNEELKEEVTEEGSDDLLPACAVNHADINTAMSQIGWQVYKSHDSSYIREDDDDASLQLVDDEDVRHSSSDSDPSARETMTSMIVYNNEGGDATRNCDAISADDFLPLFTYSLVGKLLWVYVLLYDTICVCCSQLLHRA